MLVGCGMNAQSAVRVSFGMVFRLKLIRGKGFWIVLLRVCRNRGGIQANKGTIHDTQFVEFFHLFRHDFLQFPVVLLFEKTVVSPVGWQRFCDVKTTIVSDEAVVIQVIPQICDLGKPLAFHNDECTGHRFFRETPSPGCRSGQCEIQLGKQFVIEHSGALGCEQRYILNDFLSVDSGQPLSG